nr:unnamed protein product [Digitaria exilis]
MPACYPSPARAPPSRTAHGPPWTSALCAVAGPGWEQHCCRTLNPMLRVLPSPTARHRTDPAPGPAIASARSRI